jgi:hypothetical protein
LILGGVALPALTSCANARSDRPADTYASISKLPDWSGAWVIPVNEFGDGQMHEEDPKDPRAPAFIGPYATALVAWHVRQMTGKDPENVPPARSNSERCLPIGMPGLMRPPIAIEFLFTPGRVTVLTEDAPAIRRIYTDGRSHSRDPQLTYAGESIGHWDGDTLVIDTTAISSKAQFLDGVNTSGRAHVIERIHLQDAKHLRIDTVVEDPVALAEPWHYSRTYDRYPPAFVEYDCSGNNRDATPDPDLTPPP